MHRWILAVALAAATAIGVAPALAGRGDDRGSRDDGGKQSVTYEEVTFTVQNVNGSKLACATDGKQYRIRGHIVAPKNG